MAETALPARATIAEAIASRRAWARDALCGWVRCPSVLGAEEGAQEYAAGLYEQLGLRAELLPVDVDRIRSLPGFSPVDWTYGPTRPNAVGVHRGGPGRKLVLNGHVDVVSAEPSKLWSGAPYQPRVVEDAGETWIYGRGAGDMKGGSVAMLWALAALRELGLAPAGDVIVQSPIEEECSGNGTLALLAAGYGGDGCIIPEPFDETILVQQVGVVWFQLRVLGKTTHVLGAGRGVNAIEKSWRLIEALRELEVQANQPEVVPADYRDIDHPLNLNVGVIEGGDWASTVAGECVTRFRFGLFPGESLTALRARIEARVAEAAAGDPWLAQFPPAVEWIGFQAEGCRFDVDGALGQSLRHAHRAWRGAEPGQLRATCTTDVRHFNLYYDTPATCYGPKAEAIHGVDERVSLDSMQRVAEVLTSSILDWCGARPRE
jgi:acetylornithine deacetylase